MVRILVLINRRDKEEFFTDRPELKNVRDHVVFVRSDCDPPPYPGDVVLYEHCWDRTVSRDQMDKFVSHMRSRGAEHYDLKYADFLNQFRVLRLRLIKIERAFLGDAGDNRAVAVAETADQFSAQYVHLIRGTLNFLHGG